MQTLTGLTALIARAKVLATSAIAWLTAASATLVVLAQLLDGIGGVPEWVTRGIASVVAVIATITLQVRRVTPVAKADQGLLPPKGPAVEAIPNDAAVTTENYDDPRLHSFDNQGRVDRGEIGLAVLFLIVALVCFVIFTLAAHGTITTDEGFTWLGAGLVFATLAKLVP